MPKLEIDGRPIEVPAGTRVIQAARMLGISIPTMCYIEGLEPFTSCMICQVKNEANGKMLAGCSAPAEATARRRATASARATSTSPA